MHLREVFDILIWLVFVATTIIISLKCYQNWTFMWIIWIRVVIIAINMINRCLWYHIQFVYKVLYASNTVIWIFPTWRFTLWVGCLFISWKKEVSSRSHLYKMVMLKSWITLNNFGVVSFLRKNKSYQIGCDKLSI